MKCLRFFSTTVLLLATLAVATCALVGCVDEASTPDVAQTAVNRALVRSLIDSLGDPRPIQRAHAATTLGQLRVCDKAVIKALIDTLDDLDHGVREAAVSSALGSIGPDAKEAVRALIRVFLAHAAQERAVVVPLGAMAQTDSPVH